MDSQGSSAGSSEKEHTPWLAFSRAKGRTSAVLEEERGFECDGWMCPLGCMSGGSTTRKRKSITGDIAYSITGAAQDTPRHFKDKEYGKKLCVMAKYQCRPCS